MTEIATIKVTHKDIDLPYVIINESDYNPDVHSHYKDSDASPVQQSDSGSPSSVDEGNSSGVEGGASDLAADNASNQSTDEQPPPADLGGGEPLKRGRK